MKAESMLVVMTLFRKEKEEREQEQKVKEQRAQQAKERKEKRSALKASQDGDGEGECDGDGEVVEAEGNDKDIVDVNDGSGRGAGGDEHDSNSALVKRARRKDAVENGDGGVCGGVKVKNSKKRKKANNALSKIQKSSKRARGKGSTSTSNLNTISLIMSEEEERADGEKKDELSAAGSQCEGKSDEEFLPSAGALTGQDVIKRTPRTRSCRKY
jgi:hypothetical protein